MIIDMLLYILIYIYVYLEMYILDHIGLYNPNNNKQHISANNQNHTNFSQLQFVMSQDVAVGRGGESEAGVLRARGFDRGLDRVVSSKKKGGKTGRSEQIHTDSLKNLRNSEHS